MGGYIVADRPPIFRFQPNDDSTARFPAIVAWPAVFVRSVRVRAQHSQLRGTHEAAALWASSLTSSALAVVGSLHHPSSILRLLERPACLAQTTARTSGALLPPSPPTEKAS